MPSTAPKALSLDLDDTLWPIWPVIEQAEHALHAFLCERCPSTARMFPVAEMRLLRDRIAGENPHLAHDFTVQRRLSLAHAMRSAGDDEMQDLHGERRRAQTLDGEAEPGEEVPLSRASQTAPEVGDRGGIRDDQP